MQQFAIQKIKIENFRNLEPVIVDLSPNINCIFGDNGNGKTNFLEAIYYFCYGKSFRKNTGFPQILSVESEQPEILFSSLFNHPDEENAKTRSGKVFVSSSEWRENGRPMKRKKQLPAVFINPFDSFQFHTSATYRRKWFDGFIGKYDSQYKTVLNRYNTALRFRNQLLQKKPAEWKQQLEANEAEFASLTEKIIAWRLKFLSQLKIHVSNTFQSIFSEEHEIYVDYESPFKGYSQQQIQEYFFLNRQKDQFAAKTTSGVHLDHYTLYFDGINSFEFCSLGQQKMSYLSLIFAYIELFRYKFATYPIVLIDDISGELDRTRWEKLVRFLKQKEFQVLITTANEGFKEELATITQARKIFIDSGRFVLEENRPSLTH